MRILLLSSAYNSLTQHAHVELAARGHVVGVATGMRAEGMRAAVGRFRPDLILCPMLAQVIPRDLWEKHPCLILHPGIVGDRGGHSLDWAILDQEAEWGVTVVEAAEHVEFGGDLGDRALQAARGEQEQSLSGRDRGGRDAGDDGRGGAVREGAVRAGAARLFPAGCPGALSAAGQARRAPDRLVGRSRRDDRPENPVRRWLSRGFGRDRRRGGFSLWRP